MKPLALHLANEAAGPATALLLQNDSAIGEDGWAMLAPYCDRVTRGTPANLAAFQAQFPALPVGSDGTVQVLQRVDRESATRLANDFNGVLGRVKRFFRGAPLYLGHPDVPGMQDRHPDKEPKGTIARLESREDGLYCLPVFNDAGADLLNNQPGLGLSAHWDGEPVVADGRLVFRPSRFLSAGLTTRPNLPVQLLNSKPPEMDLKKLIGLIAALKIQGLTLANDATEQQVEAAFQAIATAVSGAVGLANERQTLANERDQLRTDLASERIAHRRAILDAAVADGRITEADRAIWDSRLCASFANEATALAGLDRRFRTASQTDGSRRSSPAAPAAHDQLIALANEKLTSGAATNWDAAWRLACQEKPALLASLQEPASA